MMLHPPEAVSSRRTSACPHPPQKRSFARTGRPHPGQEVGGDGSTAFPQALQNRAPGRTSTPQNGHTRPWASGAAEAVFSFRAGGAAATEDLLASGASASACTGGYWPLSSRAALCSRAKRSLRATSRPDALGSADEALRESSLRRKSARRAAWRSNSDRRSSTGSRSVFMSPEALVPGIGPDSTARARRAGPLE